jgi:hypothetical protein
MALRLSCLIHCAVFLFFSAGAMRVPMTTLPSRDASLSEGSAFVKAVAGKIPLWETDDLAPYERVEIATVKADIAMATQVEDEHALLTTINKLQEDWDALIALDAMLRKEWLI